MRRYIGSDGYSERGGTARERSCRADFRRVLRRILGVGSFALALLALTPGATVAQSPPSQLVIDSSQSKNSIDENITSIVFNDDYTLTLIDGQTLRPVLLSRTDGAKLVLGNGVTKEQSWTISTNSPSWTGTIKVLDDNELVLNSGATNPLGAYSTTNEGSSGALILNNGATFSIPQQLAPDGTTIERETRIGRLETGYSSIKPEMDFANLYVGDGQKLTVENGFDINDRTGLTKSGGGTLEIMTNGSSGLPSGYTTLNMGDIDVASGVLRVTKGTADVSDVDMSVNTIALGKDATLDIQSFDTITLGGKSGDVVFAANDGSTVNFYVGEESHTNFVASTYNTYIHVGEATFDIESVLLGNEAPETLTLFSTGDVGQTTYDPSKITVKDNILGKNYVVDTSNLTSNSIVVKLEEAEKFTDTAPAGNQNQVARSLDRLIASGRYNADEYELLAELENNMGSLDMSRMTGELHASTIGFSYMNQMMMQQALFNTLRNNSLVAYSESMASSVAPQDYDAGGIRTQPQNRANYPINYGSASNGYFDGPLYYNSDTNSYTPGVVPTPGQPPTGIYNGEYIGGYGDPNSFGVREFSSLATMRGQTAQYGDPGTLIYSAWAEAFGSSLDARTNKMYSSYDGEQYGVLAGLDLFGSCDCRFGIYYGYQNSKIDNLSTIGELETNDHEIGLYHQFGDENVYNIATFHGGYGRYKTKRVSAVLDEARTLFSKHDAWNAGASFERGMNFRMQPVTFSPYAQIEYNYFDREKFTEEGDSDWAYRLRVNGRNCHSLRGQVGARLALDMYPGDQQVRLVLNGAYVHEFLDDMHGETHAAFVGLPTSSGFDIYGNSLGRDWALMGLGGEWTPIPALNLFVRGDYILNKYTRNPGGSAGLKYRW